MGMGKWRVWLKSCVLFQGGSEGGCGWVWFVMSNGERERERESERAREKRPICVIEKSDVIMSIYP